MQLGISFGSIFSFVSWLENSPAPCPQHAKKVVSNSLTLVNSAIVIVNSLRTLLKRPVKVFGGIQMTRRTVINHAFKKYGEKG